jgi:hypothetical protein
VQTGFYPTDGGLRLVDARGPAYKLTERFTPPQAAGGVVTYRLRRIQGSVAAARVTTTVIRTRVGRGGVATLRFRLPPVGEFSPQAGVQVSESFGGTQFAAARPTFGDFALEELPKFHGPSLVQFSPPCSPRRC